MFAGFLISSVSSPKPRSFSSVHGAGNIQLEQAQETMGGAPVLSHCSLLINPRPKLTGEQEHFREREPICWLYNFRGVPFLPHR